MSFCATSARAEVTRAITFLWSSTIVLMNFASKSAPCVETRAFIFDMPSSISALSLAGAGWSSSTFSFFAQAVTFASAAVWSVTISSPYFFTAGDLALLFARPPILISIWFAWCSFQSV
jgi:hypothetical protein